jgi:enoyl-CoA hydratase/carnithine racemase
VPEGLRIDRHGRVTVFTIDRPERRNAFTSQLAADFEAEVEAFEADNEQRVLVITGAGDKAFSSGADLSEMKDVADTDLKLPTAPDQHMFGVGKCEKPVIAAINGLAVGAGLELAICCDIRLAAETAWFALPEAERGFIAGVAAVTLPRLMPIGAVMDLMLTGERLSAKDAHRLGLVEQVMPASALMDAAMQRAERMSKFSPSALWGTKQIIRHWRNRGLDEHDAFYRQTVAKVFTSGDVAEGLKAFAEKRPPEYNLNWPPRT